MSVRAERFEDIHPELVPYPRDLEARRFELDIHNRTVHGIETLGLLYGDAEQRHYKAHFDVARFDLATPARPWSGR